MIQICPPDCPNRKPGCHSSCLAEYHAQQAYNRAQKDRINDSIRGVLAPLPVDKRNCHVTRDPGRSERPGKGRRK